MAEFQGDRISELKDPGCWRLCHVQTSGCMATERRTDESNGSSSKSCSTTSQMEAVTWSGLAIRGSATTPLKLVGWREG